MEKPLDIESAAYKPRVFGILVGYYAEYASDCSHQFAALLSALSSQENAIFVDNSNSIAPSRVEPLSLVGGNNDLAEFTGWEAGIRELQIRNCLADEDVVVLANDTFCKHRHFGNVERALFCKAVRRVLIARSDDAIVGEVNSVGETFEVLGLDFRYWVSTYLFALRWRTLKALLPLAIPVEQHGRLVRVTTEEACFWGAAVSESLKEFLGNWLFRPEAKRAWYKAERLKEENKVRFYRKALCILSEEYLSARFLHLGGQLVHAYRSPLYRAYRRMRWLLVKTFSKASL